MKRLRAAIALGTAGGVVIRAARRRHFDLADRVVAVTGGSRGLGLDLAREFGRRGARVAICARDNDTLERARGTLEGLGIPVLATTADVGDSAQAAGFVRAVLDRWQRIDVLVNNAGVIQVGPFDTMTLTDYEEALRTNFWSALYTTRAVVPVMRRLGGGRIVNICSIGGKISMPHLLPYCTGKFAMAGFSEGLAAELRRDHIAVTTVFPGLMRTGSPRHAIFKGHHREEHAWFSIADALPAISMSTERAARLIVDACIVGDAHVVLSAPARIAALAHALAPGAVIAALALVNRLLPPTGGIGSARATGLASESGWSPSLLTRLSDRAAPGHNQVA